MLIPNKSITYNIMIIRGIFMVILLPAGARLFLYVAAELCIFFF